MQASTKISAKSNGASGAVEILPFHEAADIFPLMEGAEFDQLVADIKEHGLRESIVTFEEKVIDGRNRARACAKAGIAPHYRPFQGEAKDIAAFIISANIRRRHLSAEDKTNALEQLIKLHPEKSNRQHAKVTGFSHPHVAKVRAKLQQAGDVETVTTSVDTRGRKQPARKTRKTNELPAFDLCRLDLADDSLLDCADDGVRRALQIFAPPGTPRKSQPDATLVFMALINQLLRLTPHGLRLSAANAARVADLRIKLQQVIIENSGASAPGAAAHGRRGGNGIGAATPMPPQTE